MTNVPETQVQSKASGELEESLSALERLVGNTPLLGIRYRFRRRQGILFAKCEHMNLTGSIKDRMALHILRKAYASGDLRPGEARCAKWPRYRARSRREPP